MALSEGQHSGNSGFLFDFDLNCACVLSYDSTSEGARAHVSEDGSIQRYSV